MLHAWWADNGNWSCKIQLQVNINKPDCQFESAYLSAETALNKTDGDDKEQYPELLLIDKAYKGNNGRAIWFYALHG